MKENILAAVKYDSIYVLNLKLKVTIGSSSQTSICFPSVKLYILSNSSVSPRCVSILTGLQNSHKQGNIFYFFFTKTISLLKCSWFIILICLASTVSFSILIILLYARLHRTLIPSIFSVWIQLQKLKHQYVF